MSNEREPLAQSEQTALYNLEVVGAWVGERTARAKAALEEAEAAQAEWKRRRTALESEILTAHSMPEGRLVAENGQVMVERFAPKLVVVPLESKEV